MKPLILLHEKVLAQIYENDFLDKSLNKNEDVNEKSV